MKTILASPNSALATTAPTRPAPTPHPPREPEDPEPSQTRNPSIVDALRRSRGLLRDWVEKNVKGEPR